MGRAIRSTTICARGSPIGWRRRASAPEAAAAPGADRRPACRGFRPRCRDSARPARNRSARRPQRCRPSPAPSKARSTWRCRATDLGGAGALVESVLRPEVSSPNAEDAILSAEDATPIVDVATLDEAPTVPGAEPPPPVAAALPIGPENRSASGEIVVRPAKTKIKHSPAAEVRLAHLREERARAFVRSSQSLTPPGSARALDEPPPLLDGPAPEPLQRPTHAARAGHGGGGRGRRARRIPSTTAPPPSRHTGALISAAVALVVVVIGGMWLASRHDKAADSIPPRWRCARPRLRRCRRRRGRPSGPAGGRAEPGRRRPQSAKPAVAHTAAAAPSHDETEERISDPKLARARLAEAPALLVACRTSYQEARMKDAEAACTAARDANPGSAEANGFLAHALLNRNRRRESLAAAERAIKLNPKWADAYVIIGGVHQDAGEMADARRAYQRYLELAPQGEFAGDLRAIVDRLGKL